MGVGLFTEPSTHRVYKYLLNAQMTVLRKYIKYEYNSKTLGLLVMCYSTVSGFCLKECLGTLSSPDSWPKFSISKAIPSVLIYSVSHNEIPQTGA